jgi:precorrin-2/cobalt-factor-2 C20-methyltransferase
VTTLSGPPTGAPSRVRLVGVGVGPGDPELLTLRAARAIREAEVVFAPTRRPGGRSLALEIVKDLVDERRQTVLVVPFPDAGAGDRWDLPAHTVVEALGTDRRGVFLTEGDPSMFGSFGHLSAAIRRFRPGLDVETVPGVSSVTAAAAAAGVMLADDDDRLAIVPATAGSDAVEAALRDFECVVLLKVGPALREMIGLLERLDLISRTVYVRRCGWPDREIVRDVRTLAESPPRDYFALLIVRRR